MFLFVCVILFTGMGALVDPHWTMNCSPAPALPSPWPGSSWSAQKAYKLLKMRFDVKISCNDFAVISGNDTDKTDSRLV